MVRAIEQRHPGIEDVAPNPPVSAEADAQELPPAGAEPWWRRTLSELQERDAPARPGQRELRLNLDKPGADLRRAEATLAVRDANPYFEPASELPTAAVQLRSEAGVPKLEWGEQPAGCDYRVVLGDVMEGRYVIKQPVEAPAYDISVDELVPSHLYRWRVQGPDANRARWKDIFPELLLSEDAGPGASELKTAVHALAQGHGEQGEDDELLVAKDAVRGTAYALDRSKLDPRRWWTYRVQQVLKEGGWADLLKYGTLHPPVERRPRRRPPAKPEVKVTHVVLTRFSLRSNTVGFRGEWPPGWLERRLELFERYCLPSVLAQTTQDFRWIVFCDPLTPEGVVERLRGFSDRITVAECRPTSSQRGNHPDDLRDLDRYVDPASEVVISTRLDSDDALNREAIAQIQSHAGAFLESSDDLLLHAFPLGCKLDVVNRLVYRSRYQQNPFLSLFERPGNDVQGVMRMSHTKLEQFCPLERDFGLLGWLQVLHAGNVSNQLRRGDVQVHGLDLDAMFGVAAA